MHDTLTPSMHICICRLRSLRQDDAGPHVWPSFWSILLALTGSVRAAMLVHELPPRKRAAASLRHIQTRVQSVSSARLNRPLCAAGAGGQCPQTEPDAAYVLARHPAEVHNIIRLQVANVAMAFHRHGSEAALQAIRELGAEFTELVMAASRLVQRSHSGEGAGATDAALCTHSPQHAPLTASPSAPSTARIRSTRSVTKTKSRFRGPHRAARCSLPASWLAIAAGTARCF